VNGFSVAYTVAGGVVLWSGIKGSSISDTFRSVLAGSTSPPVTERIATGAPAAATVPSAAGDTGAHSAGAAANQAIAKVLAAPYGWSAGTQWTDLVSLWNRESGWSNTAQNPTSTAYGIAQFLDTTWSAVGAAKTSDPTVQISAGLKYIKQRYGSPSAAWAHEQANGWY
jgi:hypothetical protein